METMETIEAGERQISAHLCAALVTLGGRVVLVVGGEGRWRRDPGCTFIPLELPGGACSDGALPETSPEMSLATIGRRWLGRPLQLRSADVTYGPSRAHAIDRLPTRKVDAPLLSLQRLAPADPATGGGVRRVIVEVFRATLARAHETDTETDTETDGEAGGLEPPGECAGLLLVSWQALRQVVRGLPLADLLARDDVTFRLLDGVALPPDALMYLTAEYGERTLLRVVAKYGLQALGKDV